MEREAVGLLCPHSLPFSISYKKKKFQNTPASSSPTSPSFGHPPYRTSFFLLITEGQVVMRARRREEQERTRGLVQEGEMRGTKREKEKKKNKYRRGEEQGGRRRREEKKKKDVRTPEATGSLIDQSVVPRRDGFTLPTGYVAAAVIVLRQSRTAARKQRSSI